MDDRDIVSALRVALAEKVGQDRFEVWFGPSTRLTLRHDTLVVAASNSFLLDYLRGNLRGEVVSAASAVVGQTIDVQFRLDESLAVKPNSAAPGRSTLTVGGKATSKSSESLSVRSSEVRPTVGGFSASLLTLPQPEPSASGRPASGRQYAQFDDLVVGPCNRLAFTSAEMVLERPGSISPLVLHGSTGVGKTLLMEGLVSAARRRYRSMHVLYITAEQFTTQFLEALRGSGLPNFRRKYRGVDLLIIDDLQFFAGKRATIVELQNTIDTLLQAKKQLVFAADRAPAELHELGPELTARLAGGLVCKLESPDQSVRFGIVGKLAAKLGLDVPDDVRQFVASHCTAQPRELSGALLRLQAMSQASSQPITLALAEEALDELVRHNGRALRLADINRAVCDAFGLEAECLQSDRKTKLVAHPRMLAMWLARKHTRAALTEIGAFFGRRSHSTVISAQKTVGQWMTQQSSVALADKNWNVEEAIRRVEEKLRA